MLVNVHAHDTHSLLAADCAMRFMHSSQNPLQREGLLISGSGFFTTEAGGFSDKSREGSEFGGGFSAEQSKNKRQNTMFFGRNATFFGQGRGF